MAGLKLPKLRWDRWLPVALILVVVSIIVPTARLDGYAIVEWAGGAAIVVAMLILFEIESRKQFIIAAAAAVVVYTSARLLTGLVI